MEERFSVRPARLSDMDRILTIERAGFGRWAWDRNLFAEYLADCGELFLVAESGEKVIGYCIVCITRRLMGSRAHLESIAVAPAMRGKGASDALMRAVLRRVKRRGIGRMDLMVKVTNERARGFYERYGFRKIRRVLRYYEDGEDGLLFRLELEKCDPSSE
jgi:ribosomal-protein-alanine N-acetyltransferase